MTTGIRECPFCGSGFTSFERPDVKPSVLAIGCSNCGALGPGVNGSNREIWDWEIKAIEVWNTRKRGKK